MKIREYIEKIIENGKREDMQTLSEMLDELICDLKEKNPKLYYKYKSELYELANGKVLTDDMAHEWVNKMQPIHEFWTYEETTNAMRQMGYNLDKIEFYVVANMMMNDYNNLVKDNEELALKMAKDWLNDTDSVENKLYEYHKYIVK